MTQMQILAMDRAGEPGEVIFRTPCSVGSGEVGRGQLVPIEPTDEMLMAGRCVDIERGAWLLNLPVSDIRRIYCAMLAAATEGAV